MRALGIDLGDRRVGIAVWDDVELPPRALCVLAVTPETQLAKVRELVAREKPTHVVIGLPLRLDGRESPATRVARNVARALESTPGLVVELVDERFTTAQVYTSARSAGRSVRATRENVDAEAAAVLLGVWAERVRRAQEPPE